MTLWGGREGVAGLNEMGVADSSAVTLYPCIVMGYSKCVCVCLLCNYVAGV